VPACLQAQHRAQASSGGSGSSSGDPRVHRRGQLLWLRWHQRWQADKPTGGPSGSSTSGSSSSMATSGKSLLIAVGIYAAILILVVFLFSL
jgi:hypothetical protein